MHWWKDLSMDFVMRLTVYTNWKGAIYDSILVIIDWLTKMRYYEPIKVIINILGFAEVILNIVIQYYSLSNSIVSDWGLVFISKFWSLLCYFLGIKQKLSITFHSKTHGQNKRQNYTMEAFLQVFINFEQDD